MLFFEQIDMDTLKNLLNKVTEDIIENEFYNEYDKVFYNIDDFMRQFDGSQVILSVEEFVDIVREFKFEGVLLDDDNYLWAKITLLYELGVIGLKFEPEHKKMIEQQDTLCFVFNEGMYPLETMLPKDPSTPQAP